MNLYACLGGNRYKWNDVSDIDVTAVELDENLAQLYQDRFPDDTVIVGDAHQYLLDNYANYDFIWSSPPCPTHSKSRFWAYGKSKPVYPDMKLYEEIIFLKHHISVEQKYVIENVTPYYEPLINGERRGRHLFWANFKIPSIEYKDKTGKMNWESRFKPLLEYHEIKNFNYQGEQSRLKILRNLVDFRLGKVIFEAALDRNITNNKIQETLF